MKHDLSRVLGISRSLLIYYGQPWQRRKLQRFYRSVVRPGDLAFDIGAHVGSRSRTLLSLGASVVAVEPQSDFANLIRRRLRHERLTLLHKAVGRHPGVADLHVSSRHPTVTTSSPSWISYVSDSQGFEKVAWDRLERVEMTTLDEMISAYGLPAFCKIDVEGSEADILRGLSHAIPMIAFEYLPAAMSVALEALEEVRRLGHYQFNRTIGEDHHFIHHAWLTAEQMAEELSKLQGSTRSGDIYARLITWRRKQERTVA